jgi:DNA-binding protein YbaB
MFGDIFNKLKEAQNIMSTSKTTLENIIIEHKSACGRIEIKLNANKEIQSISIHEHQVMTKEELENILLKELNNATTKAETIAQNELKNKASEIFPDISKFL